VTNGARCFLINSEGSISPSVAPHLALGISLLPTLRLVKQNSPNKVIFNNVNLLKENQSSLNKTGEKIRSEGIKLEFLSHPGCSLVQKHEMIKYNSFLGFRVGIGASNEAFQVHFLQNGEIMLRDSETFLHIYGGKLAEGQPICLLQKVPLWYRLWYLKQQRRFKINNDGSISPMYAPYLVIGSY